MASPRPEHRTPTPDNLRPDLKSEATGQPIEVVFEGETYLIPPQDDWPFEVLEAIENEAYYTMVRLVVGPENWDRIRAQKWTIGAFNRFVEVLNAIQGNS